MGQLIFPEDINDNSPFVMLTPYEWTIQRKEVLRPESIKQVEGDVIVLHPPNSGIIDSVSHSWDEAEGLVDPTSSLVNKVVGRAVEMGGQTFTRVALQDTFFNDFMTLAYNGSSFREFSLTWQNLVPKSLNEAQTLANIIRYIKLKSTAAYGQDIFVKFPNAWTVNVYTPGREIMRWENCVMTRTAINYMPEGVLNHFRSGHPMNIEIDIAFKQLRKSEQSDYQR